MPTNSRIMPAERLDCSADLLHLVAHVRRQLPFHPEQLDQSADHLQRIVEFVSDRRQHVADRGHPVDVDQILELQAALAAPASAWRFALIVLVVPAHSHPRIKPLRDDR